MDSTGIITPEGFNDRVVQVLSELENSGIFFNDEADAEQVNLCLLVPEQFVSLLIGKAGANINTIKAASGASLSFQKKENSVHGLRKCFHSGTVSEIIKAVYIVMAFSGDNNSSTGIVVSHNAAGAVIGKGGENLKNIREQTGCQVSMEKSSESNPSFGGRCLSLRNAERGAMARALYMAIRCPGFSSPTSDDQTSSYDAQASYGYGPASTSHDGKRYSPYGQTTSGEMCALHGKKRGKQNLQASPTMPGQYVCLSTDPCKGGAAVAAGGGMAQGMNMQGMMGGGMGGMNMGGMGMGGMNMGGGMGGMAGMYGMDSYCAIHGKKRGPRNLQPHPQQPGLYTCMETDPCKAAGDLSMGGMPQVNSASICATHGKKRGTSNLQPHPTDPSLFVCLDNDQCK